MGKGPPDPASPGARADYCSGATLAPCTLHLVPSGVLVALPVAAVKPQRSDGIVEAAAVVVAVAMTTLVSMRLFGAW